MGPPTDQHNQNSKAKQLTPAVRCTIVYVMLCFACTHIHGRAYMRATLSEGILFSFLLCTKLKLMVLGVIKAKILRCRKYYQGIFTSMILLVSIPKISTTFTITLYMPASLYSWAMLVNSSVGVFFVLKLCHSFSNK
jgi:hypothetical protein